MSGHLDDVRSVYGCACGQCRRAYERAQSNRDPYYRPPRLSEAEAEAEAYADCRRDPYARDPYDDGAAGW